MNKYTVYLKDLVNWVTVEADFFEVNNGIARFIAITEDGEEEWTGHFTEFLCIVKEQEKQDEV